MILILLVTAFHLSASATLAEIGQAAAPTLAPRLVEVRVQPGAPTFGEEIDLHVTLRLAGGVEIALPDTLRPSAAIQSIREGAWSVSSVVGDSLEVRAVYPVIAFRDGQLDLPSLDVAVNAVAATLPLGTAFIAPFPRMDSEAPSVARPPADVFGGTWSVWLLIAVGVVSLTGVGWTSVLLPRWWRGRGTALAGRLRHGSPREDALRELDEILATAWHRNGRVDDFYAASTDTVRRFAAQVDPAWVTALTSSELLGRIDERFGSPAVSNLLPVVETSERVKFGRQRPDGDAAERDWVTIRDWIRTAPAE